MDMDFPTNNTLPSRVPYRNVDMHETKESVS